MLSEDVELLLIGLQVDGIAELKRLVDLGRTLDSRLGRRAELVASVASIEDPRERLLASLDLTIQEGQMENGLYAYVVADDGTAIQAVGVWSSEADAFLAVSEADAGDTDDDRFDRRIVPFFADHVPESL